MITSLLSVFQLNEKERIVFEKLLEVGGNPASHIARLAELSRNTTRDILDKLTKKGLVVRTRSGNTQYYAVDSVENIVRFVEIRKKKEIDRFDQQMEFIRKYRTELEPHKFHKTRPKVTFYEGEDGLQRVYEDTLHQRSEILAFASLEHMYEALPNYFPRYFKRRAKKKIPIRAIFPDSEEGRKRQKYDEKELRQSRLVPSEKFQFTPEINIYGDKVIFISWKEKMAVMIESEEIAKAMKVIFELSWLGTERMGLE